MKTFALVWNSGKTEIGEGENIGQAFTKLGYSAGAIMALDYFQELPESNFNCNNVFVVQALNDGKWVDTIHQANTWKQVKKMEKILIVTDSVWLGEDKVTRIAINKDKTIRHLLENEI